MNIQELINSACKDNRESKEQTSWHASSLGGCLTKEYLKRAGIATPEFDDRTLRVFKAGNMFEDWLVSLLEKQGADFETQVRCEWPEQNLTGYADLVMDGLIYEIKSKQSRAFHYMNKKGEGANAHHKMQVWAYMKCLDIPESRIVYLSKDDMCVLEYPVFLNDKELEEAVIKELTILNEAWKQKLPPPPVEDKLDWRYKYCSVHEDHCLKQEKYLDVSQFEK